MPLPTLLGAEGSNLEGVIMGHRHPTTGADGTPASPLPTSHPVDADHLQHAREHQPAEAHEPPAAPQVHEAQSLRTDLQHVADERDKWKNWARRHEDRFDALVAELENHGIGVRFPRNSRGYTRFMQPQLVPLSKGEDDSNGARDGL